MGPVALDGGDQRGDMVDAPAALERAPGVIQIPDIAVHAFNIEAFQTFVVVLVPEQHPHPDAVVQQPAQEIGSHVPGRSGQEYGGCRCALLCV